MAFTISTREKTSGIFSNLGLWLSNFWAADPADKRPVGIRTNHSQTATQTDPAPKRFKPYVPRRVNFLDLWRDEDWTIKIYGISTVAEVPSPATIAIAKRLAQQTLPKPAVCSEHHGAALLMIHEGCDCNYILVDWWFGQNMLKNFIFTATKEMPHAYSPAREAGLSYCVWELGVLDFERRAWIDHILKKAAAPDFEGYYRARFEGKV